jgi:hypothetical protein
MRFPRRRTAILAVATGAAIVVTAGTASAYWTTSGSGRGAARSGAAGILGVDSGTTTSALVPGSTADVAAVISNPNDYPLLITSVTTPSGGIPGFTDSQLLWQVPTCDAGHSGVTAVRTTRRPASFVIAPHGSYTVTLAGAVTMSNESDNSCQGLFFAVAVTVTASSAADSTPTAPAAGTL